ncbi:helix-turn-helix domain-containing protein [Hyphomicrobium nitrativorans]|nr:helix-turn-helix domain-containing protein [Hyphomicrobium nitrativorans]
MTPIALAAAFNAFGRWQFVRGLVALALAACCFAYATVSSLGFVSGARDVAAATRGAEADAYAIARDKAKVANVELATLAAAPRGNRKTEAARAERKAKLEADRADAERVMAAGATATVADPTAASMASYAAALGYEVEPAKLSPWLVLLSVIFFELGAAASLIVVGALPGAAAKAEPAKSAPAVEPKPVPEVAAAPAMADAPEAPQDDRKTVGRKRSRALDDVLAKIKSAGGQLEGPLDELGERLGLSKSSAHRALHALAGLGAVNLATSAAGTLVQLR